jgi:hypothetical protein
MDKQFDGAWPIKGIKIWRYQRGDQQLLIDRHHNGRKEKVVYHEPHYKTEDELWWFQPPHFISKFTNTNQL